ncbi:MAG: DMT family transporter [Thermodesulfobacteriota bacterium]
MPAANRSDHPLGFLTAPSRRNRLAGALLFALAMAFGGSSVVVSKGCLVGAPVVATTCLTLLVALVGLLPLQWRRRQELARLSRGQLANLFWQGLFGIVLFRILSLYGLRHTGATQAAIITGTTPAMITLFSVLFLGERPGRRRLAAIGLAVAGVMVINLRPGAGSGGEQPLVGSLLVLGAVAAEAAMTVCRKAVAGSVSALSNTFAVVAICTLMTLPLAAVEGLGAGLRLDRAFVLGILWYGWGATVLGYLCFMAGTARISASAAGVLSAMFPVSAVLLATLFLAEPFTSRQLAGCSLVVAAILLTALEGRRRSRPDAPGPGAPGRRRWSLRAGAG